MSRLAGSDQMVAMDGVDAEEGGWAFLDERGSPSIVSFNEGGYNSTSVDVKDALLWIVKNRPAFLVEILTSVDETSRGTFFEKLDKDLFCLCRSPTCSGWCERDD